MLNNQALLKYAEKKEVSENEIYDERTSIFRRYKKYAVIILVVLAAISVWWYYGRKNKNLKKLISKWRWAPPKPQPPSIPTKLR